MVSAGSRKGCFGEPVPAARINIDRLVMIFIAAVLLLFLVLRLVNVGHTLSWDEAWNVNAIMDGAGNYTDDASSFFPAFYRHPPAYTGTGLLIASLTGMDRSSLAKTMQLLSILFGLLLAAVVYICAKDWFGKGAGLAAVVSLALMPSARVYDTWVKQESMVLFFTMLFLLFFFRKKQVAAGIMLGLALLTKEIAVFAPFALMLFLLPGKRKKYLRQLAVTCGIAIIASGWWYLLFSRTRGEFLDFFLGRHLSAVTWHKPWYFYLERIPSDLSWVVLALVLMGVFALFMSLQRDREAPCREVDFKQREIACFLLVWIVVVYFPLSFSYGKPPWMIYSVLPAFALLGGWGTAACREWVISRLNKAQAYALGILLLCALLFFALPMGFEQFMNRADVMYAGTLEDRRMAIYVNAWAGSRSRVMMRDQDLSPVFAYYLESYQPGRISLLPLEPERRTDLPASSDPGLLLLHNSSSAAQIMDYLEIMPVDFLVLRQDGGALEKAAGSAPMVFGDKLVFRLQSRQAFPLSGIQARMHLKRNQSALPAAVMPPG